jgi:VanZ family protein
VKRILLSVLIVLSWAQVAAAKIEPDKLSHFATSVPFGGIATALVDQFAPQHRLLGGMVLGTVPGLVVEIVDSTGSAGFSSTDLLADLVGSAVGALLTDQVILRLWFDEHGDEKTYGVKVGGTF